MKGVKSGRIIALAAVLAVGIAGSVYTGYWSKMERYLTSTLSPSSVEPPAWAKSAESLQAAAAGGGAPEASGQAVHGGPRTTGFNAGLLPRIAGYATVLGLFAALVRLVELLRTRRLASRAAEASQAAGPAVASATDAAGAAGAAGVAGAIGVVGAVARGRP